jgi:hypothetical protein
VQSKDGDEYVPPKSNEVRKARHLFGFDLRRNEGHAGESLHRCSLALPVAIYCDIFARIGGPLIFGPGGSRTYYYVRERVGPVGAVE